MYKYISDLLTLIFKCKKKNFWLNENLRDWNSQMKCKIVDEEFNEVDDGDNDSNR